MFVSFTEKTPDKDTCDKKYFRPKTVKVNPSLVNLGEPKFLYKYLYVSMLSAKGCSFDFYYSFRNERPKIVVDAPIIMTSYETMEKKSIREKYNLL